MKKILLLTVLMAGLTLMSCQKDQTLQEPDLQPTKSVDTGFDPAVELANPNHSGIAAEFILWAYGIDWYTGGYYEPTSGSEYFKVAVCFNRHLNAGRPIIAQVSHSTGGSHWIVITGKGPGVAAEEYYYSYMDPAVHPNVPLVCNVADNRILFDGFTMQDDSAPIGGTYTVTAVHSNDFQPVVLP